MPLPGAHPPPQAPGEQRQAALNVVLLRPQAQPPQDACHAQCCSAASIQVNAGPPVRAYRQQTGHDSVQSGLGKTRGPGTTVSL